MTAPTENQKLELALHKFENIMQYRSDMYMRLADRVRVIVRGGMVIVSLVAFAFSILLYTLATQLQHAANTTQHLQADLVLIGKNMTEMNQLVASMGKRMQIMEEIQNNLGGITNYTQVMAEDMQHLNKNMTSMQSRLNNIDGSLKSMTNSVSNIGDSVRHVGRNVNGASKSMPFNFMPSPP